MNVPFTSFAPISIGTAPAVPLMLPNAIIDINEPMDEWVYHLLEGTAS
ncbi:hypothetical protein [Pseudomonas sp. CHM02]|nr:hypothetical protein [Pseudomonas sp. CHM02]